jgi:hypothetical protein
MKYVSIRMPDPTPLGDTFFDAKVRAMVEALFVNSPLGGCVESVVTLATQRFFFPELFFPDGIRTSSKRPVGELVHQLKNSGPAGTMNSVEQGRYSNVFNGV